LTVEICSLTSEFFEGLYAGLWYIGPMNHAPGFDYTGSTAGAGSMHNASVYFAISEGLLLLALALRKVLPGGRG